MAGTKPGREDRLEVELQTRIWDTAAGEPPADFVAAWNARLARARHANYSVTLEYLRWQATHGEHALAVLLDEGARRALLVLRRERGELVSGFPWRWQCALEDADVARPEGMDADDADWFFAHAGRVAGSTRLRFFSPGLPAGPLAGYVAGHTVMLDLAGQTEEQLASGLDASRRRLARRSEKQGYAIVESCDEPLQRAFAELMVEMHDRRHGLASEQLPDSAAPGEHWREWDLPWHWLVLACKDGVVGAGLGSGRVAGAMVDGRASASSAEAMKAGANSLVWWEAIRLAKLAGHSWMNLCGSTTYKRQFGGVLVPIQCRLGGGLANELPNLVEKMAKAARPVAARVVKGLRNRARKTSEQKPQGGS